MYTKNEAKSLFSELCDAPVSVGEYHNQFFTRLVPIKNLLEQLENICKIPNSESSNSENSIYAPWVAAFHKVRSHLRETSYRILKELAPRVIHNQLTLSMYVPYEAKFYAPTVLTVCVEEDARAIENLIIRPARWFRYILEDFVNNSGHSKYFEHLKALAYITECLYISYSSTDPIEEGHECVLDWEYSYCLVLNRVYREAYERVLYTCCTCPPKMLSVV